METAIAISPHHVRDWIAAITRPARILVIDDEVAILELFQKLERLWNCEIMVARSGLEGLDLVSKYNFRLVLLDLKMPEMSGLSTFREIKKLKPKTPVAILSAYIDEKAVSDIQSLGFAIFIAKPFPIMSGFMQEMFGVLGILPLPRSQQGISSSP